MATASPKRPLLAPAADPAAPTHSVAIPALDWLNFFIAAMQAGFGPFIAVYLTEHRWTQGQIGIALSVGAIAGLVSQVPGGAIVDYAQRKQHPLALAVAAISLSALALALWPAPLPVLTGQVLHSLASSVQVPAIAAISVALVSRHEVAERLGRNARWTSLGYGTAAAAMGIVGTYASDRAVFLFAALLGLPALFLIDRIHPMRQRLPVAQAASVPSRPPHRLLADPRLLGIATCAALYQLANGAMLQLVGGEMTRRVGMDATLIIAAALMVPQAVVAALSPWYGCAADRFGRRPLLALGFLALPVRALLFALVGDPFVVVPLQVLDGISSTAFAVLAPLIIADITEGSGRFNLGMGLIGLAGGIGGAVSSTLAGTVADAFGISAGFAVLAAAGAAATLAAFLTLPETRPGFLTTPATCPIER